MNQETTHLPNRLSLAQDGYFEPLPDWKNPEIDDEEWRCEGWKAWDYYGTIYFQSPGEDGEEKVKEWLRDHGYVDCEDGGHWERRKP